MSDPLGEALAHYDDDTVASYERVFEMPSHLGVIVAAARNWHALTKLIRDGEDVTLWLFDALTDTAPPE